MTSSIWHIRPNVIWHMRMRFSQARFPVTTSALRLPIKRYSARQLSSRPPIPSSIWTSAKGAPAAVVPKDESGGLHFATTYEKPYQWGNLLHYFWLRDNCRCNTCINQDTRQRNFDTFEIPKDIKPIRVTTTGEGVEIEWSHGSHVSFYTWDFLEPYIKEGKPKPEDIQLEYFGAGGYPNSSIEYSEFEKDETRAIGRLTDLIRRRGFAFVSGVPTESAEPTKKLLEKIAFIRQTHYGGFYEFVPDLALADTAYTNLALAAHTDNTYFTDPSGLQSFHLLSHTDPGSPDGSGTSLGGQSLLVDGFYAAQILRDEAPDLFEVLTQVGIPCHASGNEGITIRPDKLYPVIELESETNGVHRIRWNNDDRGVVPVGGKYVRWYEAARKWREILKRKELEYWFQLQPSKVLIFDNWRVLHGRSAFKGQRRICGGYINRDDWISTWRNTNFPRNEVLRQVIG